MATSGRTTTSSGSTSTSRSTPRAGTLLYGPAAGNTLWSGFGNPCQNQNGGDPIVLYDQFADRWLMAQFTTSKPYGECVAVSTTGDPTGTWNRYFFQFSTRVFYDYPKIGIWRDGYYLTANRFGGAFGSFQGASAIVLDRTAMIAGQPAAFQEFKTSSSYGSLLPADIDGSTLPPAGAPEPIVEVGSTALHTWRFHVNWSNPSSSTFSGPSTTPVAAYNELCPSTRSCIPQPGTTVGLDGLGDRLMYRLAYRNIGGHELLVVNHSVNVNSGGTVRAGVRWYEIRNATSGTPTLYQQGTFSPDSTNRWLGSMAMDGAGNIALGYSAASSSVYAGIRVTGRLAGDTAGLMTQGETTIINGSGSQTGTGSRWGDYASMSVDPTDDCTFWFTTEYMPSTGGAPWHTRIASFMLPGCSATQVSVPDAPTNLTATAGDASVHLAWAAPTTGDPATGYDVYRDGSLVATLGNVLSFDDTGLANGNLYSYTVAATNSAGEGPAAGPVTATPEAPAPTAPGAPTGLTAIAGDTVVDLQWTAPASDGGNAIDQLRRVPRWEPAPDDGDGHELPRLRAGQWQDLHLHGRRGQCRRRGTAIHLGRRNAERRSDRDGAIGTAEPRRGSRKGPGCSAHLVCAGLRRRERDHRVPDLPGRVVAHDGDCHHDQLQGHVDCAQRLVYLRGQRLQRIPGGTAGDCPCAGEVARAIRRGTTSAAVDIRQRMGPRGRSTRRQRFAGI